MAHVRGPQHHMDEIVPGVYLGTVTAASDTDNLHRLKFSHILTVSNVRLSIERHKPFVYKYIHAQDMEDVDILSQLDDAVQFITEGVQHSKVLVHCFYGISRSASMVIAYLMKQQLLSLEAAIELVKSKRRAVRPNPGFIKQLSMYHRMGCKVDKSNPEYKAYLLQLIGKLMKRGGALEENLSEILITDPLGTIFEGHDDLIIFYKCHKCRRNLFKSSGIMQHTVGEGDAAFDWRSQARQTKSDQSKINDHQDDTCTAEICHRSLFIEPVAWMKDGIMTLTGKLSCPKCNSKLGSFNWSGERCPCGTWTTPAFHIQSSKVDACKQTLLVARASPQATEHDDQTSTVEPPIVDADS